MTLVDIENIIRNNIIDIFTTISDSKLLTHTRFLQTLRQLCMNRTIPIWIFTTNYDMLFEHAGMNAKIPVNNGFCGVSCRYFDIDKIDLVSGIFSKTGLVNIKNLI